MNRNCPGSTANEGNSDELDQALERFEREERARILFKALHRQSLKGSIDAEALRRGIPLERRRKIAYTLVAAFSKAQLDDHFLISCLQNIDRYAASHGSSAFQDLSRRMSDDSCAVVFAIMLLTLKAGGPGQSLGDLDIKDIVLESSKLPWQKIQKAELGCFERLKWNLTVPTALDVVEAVAANIVYSAAEVEGNGRRWRGLQKPIVGSSLTYAAHPDHYFVYVAAYILELVAVHTYDALYSAALPALCQAIAAVGLAMISLEAPNEYWSILRKATEDLNSEEKQQLPKIIEDFQRLWASPPSDSPVRQKWCSRIAMAGFGQCEPPPSLPEDLLFLVTGMPATTFSHLIGDYLPAVVLSEQSQPAQGSMKESLMEPDTDAEDDKENDTPNRCRPKLTSEYSERKRPLNEVLSAEKEPLVSVKGSIAAKVHVNESGSAAHKHEYPDRQVGSPMDDNVEQIHQPLGMILNDALPPKPRISAEAQPKPLRKRDPRGLFGGNRNKVVQDNFRPPKAPQGLPNKASTTQRVKRPQVSVPVAGAGPLVDCELLGDSMASKPGALDDLVQNRPLKRPSHESLAPPPIRRKLERDESSASGSSWSSRSSRSESTPRLGTVWMKAVESTPRLGTEWMKLSNEQRKTLVQNLKKKQRQGELSLDQDLHAFKPEAICSIFSSLLQEVQ